MSPWMMAKFVLSILTITVMVTGSKFTNIRDVEINQFLKKLNKPALKSIKSPDGDIIDCVHMKNHPIYDHLLFKNHTIQMRPNSFPIRSNDEIPDTKSHSILTQLWTINGKCPENSIPIRRTRKEDILRVGSIERYRKKYPNSISQPKPSNLTNNPIHEYAIIQVDGKFHGGKADINVWKPFVQTSKEFSLAQMWVVAGPSSELNSVEVGWQVYQGRYGDINPRIFIFWTANGYKSGCYNIDCPGFVHINKAFVLGAAIQQSSTLNGQQYHITTTIWKDSHTGNWWLKINENIIIGYWPSILFNHLQKGATKINWGGEIVNFKDDSQHTTTGMGSGHFADEGYKKASYFRNLEILDENDILKPPKKVYPDMTNKNCYNVRFAYNAQWKVNFFYGGPGRNNNCK